MAYHEKRDESDIRKKEECDGDDEGSGQSYSVIEIGNIGTDNKGDDSEKAEVFYSNNDGEKLGKRVLGSDGLDPDDETHNHKRIESLKMRLIGNSDTPRQALFSVELTKEEKRDKEGLALEESTKWICKHAIVQMMDR